MSNGQSFYVKVRRTTENGPVDEEWIMQILPPLMPGQYIASIELGFCSYDEEEGVIHIPVMRTPFYIHGQQIHTICQLGLGDDE